MVARKGSKLLAARSQAAQQAQLARAKSEAEQQLTLLKQKNAARDGQEKELAAQQQGKNEMAQQFATGRGAGAIPVVLAGMSCQSQSAATEQAASQMAVLETQKERSRAAAAAAAAATTAAAASAAATAEAASQMVQTRLGLHNRGQLRGARQ